MFERQYVVYLIYYEIERDGWVIAKTLSSFSIIIEVKQRVLKTAYFYKKCCSFSIFYENFHLALICNMKHFRRKLRNYKIFYTNIYPLLRAINTLEVEDIRTLRDNKIFAAIHSVKNNF